MDSHVTLKLKCSGPTGRAVGHAKFQRQRADIADDQTLTTGQYHCKAPSGLSWAIYGMKSFPAERPAVKVRAVVSLSSSGGGGAISPALSLRSAPHLTQVKTKVKVKSTPQIS